MCCHHRTVVPLQLTPAVDHFISAYEASAAENAGRSCHQGAGTGVSDFPFVNGRDWARSWQRLTPEPSFCAWLFDPDLGLHELSYQPRRVLRGSNSRTLAGLNRLMPITRPVPMPGQGSAMLRAFTIAAGSAPPGWSL